MLLCFIAKNRQKCGFAIIILSFFMDVTYPLLSSGGSRGGPGGRLGAKLTNQTKARRAEKGFLDDFPPAPPPILRSGSDTAEILLFLSVQSENELYGCYDKLTFKPWAIPTAPLNLIQFQLRSRCFKP